MRRRRRHARQSCLGSARGAGVHRARAAAGSSGEFPEGTPGRGTAMVQARNGKRALIINAIGRVFMTPFDDPFAALNRELDACPLRMAADAIVVDFHCEATSEKQAVGFFCDGRASLVVGTHTHVPTARKASSADGDSRSGNARTTRAIKASLDHPCGPCNT